VTSPQKFIGFIISCQAKKVKSTSSTTDLSSIFLQNDQKVFKNFKNPPRNTHKTAPRILLYLYIDKYASICYTKGKEEKGNFLTIK